MTVTDSEEIYGMIGKTLEGDIVTLSGALLIPKGTRITLKHAKAAVKHHFYILLDNKDIDLNQTIGHAIQELDQIFEYVRTNNSVPLHEVYHDIIPEVLKATAYPYVSRLLLLLSSQDNYTVSHSLAVSVLSTTIGRWMKFTEEQLVNLAIASTLHDIGKIKIPVEILDKPGKLSDSEYSLMKKHTLFGYEMIKATPGASQEQALAALQHHERMDGSGYPNGLQGDHISLFARIIAVADVFHAMGSKRVYHGPKPIYEIMDEMSQGLFGEFDPAILGTFLQRYMQGLIGSRVLLSNGQEAFIRMIRRDAPMRPLLESEGHFIDLVEAREICIQQLLP